MKVVICGNYGVSNLGDEAIGKGLSLVIRNIDPAAQITFMGKGSLLPIGARSFIKSLLFWEKWTTPVRIIKKADIFVLGGGGLFTEEESPLVPFLWAAHGFFALLYRKPLYILGISIGSLSGFNRWFCKMVFKRAKIVMVRDLKSQKIINSWGLDSKISPDFAFWLDDPQRIINNDQNTVVMSIRPFKNNSENLNTLIARYCDFLIQNCGFKITFLTFQKDVYFDAALSNTIFDHVRNKKSIKIYMYSNSLDEILSILKNAKFTLAMRLHAGILSAHVATPFIPLDYMNKVSNFWKRFEGIEVLPFESLSLDDLKKATEQLLEHYETHRTALKELKSVIEKEKLETEEYLKRLLTS